MSETVEGTVRRLSAGADLGPDALLGISFSMKPPDRRSAARALLSMALDTVAGVYPRVAMLDMSRYGMPFFDGRAPTERGDRAISYASDCVRRSGALLLSVPAYWGGVSGGFKNFVDCVCGPAYDLPRPLRTAFSGKPIGVLVVGADDDSTTAGAEQARRILASAGGRLVGPPVTLSNPRAREDSDEAPLGSVVELTVGLLRTLQSEEI